jgi:hypothetical protein
MVKIVREPAMQITFDIQLSPEELALLASALDCKTEEVEGKLPGHARAALGEYVEAYLGRRASGRGQDILEHRLALLIEHAFDKTIPSEVQVSRLFQTTLTSSRSLIRSTLSKYRYQLKAAADGSAKAALGRAKWNGVSNQFEILGVSANLADHLNLRLSAIDGGLRKVTPVKDTGSNYGLAADAYHELCEAFGAKEAKQK